MVLDATVVNGNVKPKDSRQAIRDLTPLPAALAPSFTRFTHFLALWVMKVAVTIALRYVRFTNPSPQTAPTFKRRYACRPSLEVRLFVPKQAQEHISTSNGNKTRCKYPLYIDIHGGGFAAGDAAIDDTFCSSWANRTGMIVASLNYSKSPLHPFPVAVHDIAALAKAVIEDETLSVDQSRVIMGGFSAGGNLCLTSSLLPELQGKIKASISYYPIVDWSAPPHDKYASRLYVDKKTDNIALAGPFLDWGYVSAGQDRKEKLLSPCYATQEELPPYICIIGAQHDMLCREGMEMMYSLAEKEMPESGTCDKGDFEQGPYKWRMVRGVRHGFTDDCWKRRGPREERRRKLCDELYDNVFRWMQEKGLLDER